MLEYNQNWALVASPWVMLENYQKKEMMIKSSLKSSVTISDFTVFTDVYLVYLHQSQSCIYRRKNYIDTLEQRCLWQKIDMAQLKNCQDKGLCRQ